MVSTDECAAHHFPNEIIQPMKETFYGPFISRLVGQCFLALLVQVKSIKII